MKLEEGKIYTVDKGNWIVKQGSLFELYEKRFFQEVSDNRDLNLRFAKYKIEPASAQQIRHYEMCEKAGKFVPYEEPDEMKSMNYGDLKRDNTVYQLIHSSDSEWLFRFNLDESKDLICMLGRNKDTVWTNKENVCGSTGDEYKIASLQQRVQFYTKLGYRDAQGRLWQIGDLDAESDKIVEFKVGPENWKKDRIWAETEIEGDRGYGGSVHWLSLIHI